MAYEPVGREREILHLFTEGLTYTAIGRKLFLSRETIKTYTSRMLRKAKVNNQAALIHWAWQNGHLGDRNQQLTEIEALRNRVENLYAMYQVAVARAGAQQR